MEISNFVLTVSAGIAGTVGMTLIMYAYAALFRVNTKVIHILGIMMTGSASDPSHNNRKYLTAGTLGHFGVGIIFSWSYFLLWNWGIFSITLRDSIIIGLVSGAMAVIVWTGYFILHYNPPKINLTHYFIALLLAHVVFGMITVNLYTLLSDQPEYWFEFRQRINAMNK